MSMVGNVVGLGDRHGENILIDTKKGMVMHVDFNCLFWKGKDFQVPEQVPFRLTQNMVDAMGILGVQGMFRNSCEITMRVLRENCDTLATVLETFIYDPLVEWTKTKGAKKDDQIKTESLRGAEMKNKIVRELKGLIRFFFPNFFFFFPNFFFFFF